MIIVRLMGGLGNQMFQYAFGKYLSLKNNTSLRIDTSLLGPSLDPQAVVRNFELNIFDFEPEFVTDNELSLFIDNSTSRLSSYIFKAIRKVYNRKLVYQNGHVYDENHLALGSNTCIVGRWQSYRYFESCADIIQKEFTFKREFSSNVNKIAQTIQHDNAVTIHVRRGDYVNHPKYSKILGPLPIEYYLKAIELIITGIDDPKFFIISDDINWCRENLPINDECTIYIDFSEEEKNYEIDLYLLSKSKNIIISNSTFSWWGAFLGNAKKSVIAPERWAIDKQHQPPHIIPPHWITIRA